MSCCVNYYSIYLLLSEIWRINEFEITIHKFTQQTQIICAFNNNAVTIIYIDVWHILMWISLTGYLHFISVTERQRNVQLWEVYSTNAHTSASEYPGSKSNIPRLLTLVLTRVSQFLNDSEWFDWSRMISEWFRSFFNVSDPDSNSWNFQISKKGLNHFNQTESFAN